MNGHVNIEIGSSQPVLSALGAQKNLEPYSSEPSKRHTMSYEPDTLQNMDHIDQKPSPIKKKEEVLFLVLFGSESLNGKNMFFC